MDALSDTAGFFQKNAAGAIIGFAKIAVLAIAFQLTLMFGMTGASMLLGAPALDPTAQALAQGSEPDVFLVLAMFVLLAFYIVVSSAIAAVPYNAIEALTKKAKLDIVRKAIGLVGPIGAYIAAMAGIALVLFGIPLIISLALPDFGVVLVPLLMLLSLSGLLILFIGTQFATADIAVNGTDAITAMRNSYSLVKKNVWGVVLFDTLLFIAVMGLTLAFGLAQQILMAIISGAAADMAMMAVLFVLSLALSVAQATVISLAGISLTYFFWKRALAG